MTSAMLYEEEEEEEIEDIQSKNKFTIGKFNDNSAEKLNEKSSQRHVNLTVSDISIRTRFQSDNDLRPQITQHVGRLYLPEISDDDKIESLIQLVSLSVSFAEGEQNGIVATSGIVESVSGLMLERTNPKIRV
ncbi:MAG: hypothetical protein EZS28_026303 [Streblomastix strix]|uniref:Uncharacterized protein n=1 Tax=Streblomastix strix TaxID=222440 RepID=A0A5J4V5S1_9EUKA|nr:MAG: hypothetical protein EZS28_026303 [Streblomastix strix]